MGGDCAMLSGLSSLCGGCIENGLADEETTKEERSNCFALRIYELFEVVPDRRRQSTMWGNAECALSCLSILVASGFTEAMFK